MEKSSPKNLENKDILRNREEVRKRFVLEVQHPNVRGSERTETKEGRKINEKLKNVSPNQSIHMAKLKGHVQCPAKCIENMKRDHFGTLGSKKNLIGFKKIKTIHMERIKNQNGFQASITTKWSNTLKIFRENYLQLRIL